RTVLDATLNFLHQDLGVLSRHQLDLAAIISYLDESVQGYSSVGYSTGNTPNHWANIFVQSLGPAGVDALVGKCGAVDQFFDHYFGTNCKTLGTAKGHPARLAGLGVKIPKPAAGGLLPTLPKLPAVPLPCTVQDLVTSILGQPS